MKLSAALGVMAAIKSGASNEDFLSLGLSPADVELLTGQVPWTGSDGLRVRRCLDAVVYGSLDIMGIARFEVSAEYLAAHICHYVAPRNYMAACSWSARVAPADEMVAQGKPTPIEARVLHAFVVKILDQADDDEFRQRFEKVTSAAQRKAEKAGVTVQ